MNILKSQNLGFKFGTLIIIGTLSVPIFLGIYQIISHLFFGDMRLLFYIGMLLIICSFFAVCIGLFFLKNISLVFAQFIFILSIAYLIVLPTYVNMERVRSNSQAISANEITLLSTLPFIIFCLFCIYILKKYSFKFRK